MEQGYIAGLEARPVYNSAVVAEVVAVRRAREAGREELERVGREEVGGTWVSCLGQVVQCEGPGHSYLSNHRGRDITARMLQHFRGQNMDGLQEPPYPRLEELTAEEVGCEYWHLVTPSHFCC